MFISPRPSDAGTYQCTAENDHGKVFSHSTLLMARKQPSKQEEGVEDSPAEEGDDDSERVDVREPRLDESVFVVYPTAAAASNGDDEIFAEVEAGDESSVDLRSLAVWD